MGSNATSPQGGNANASINASTTREDILRDMKRAGISDLESFVKANLDKLGGGGDDDAPEDSAHIFIHRGYVIIRDSVPI